MLKINSPKGVAKIRLVWLIFTSLFKLVNLYMKTENCGVKFFSSLKGNPDEILEQVLNKARKCEMLDLLLKRREETIVAAAAYRLAKESKNAGLN